MRYRFFTYNIDFGKSNAKERGSLESVRDQADVLCIQEAKHIAVKGPLGKPFYVHQTLKNQAKQGVAIAWRFGKKIKRHRAAAKRHRNFSGYVLGVGNLGLKMLPRYINFRVLDINGKTVLVISTHRPPQRFRRLWGIFDRALIRFVKSMPFPVVIGMDSNEHTHTLFAKQSGLVWYGVGIDGFWISKELVKHVVKGSLKAHPKANSDHHPVSLEFDF